jgi:tRNA(Ile)-lysidine synthase
MAASPTPRPKPADPALQALQVFTARHALVPPVAVAFSGGADSTALLHAAAALWPGQVRPLHVNHGLQAAANAFEQQCHAVCAALRLPLQVLTVQAHPQPGQSPEDAARLARYQALAGAAQGAPVLLGQHADDQAETVLLALGRGAGLSGLAAMPERFERHGAVFLRPLLEVPGVHLRQWLQERALAFIDDPSNADERFARNKLRARLMPALAQAWPHYRQTFARSARHAAQAQLILDEVAAQDLALTGCPPLVRALQQLSPARQANALRHWLAQHHGARPSTAQLDELQRQIQACSTRGHRIELRMAQGQVLRAGDALRYAPIGPAA